MFLKTLYKILNESTALSLCFFLLIAAMCPRSCTDIPVNLPNRSRVVFHVRNTRKTSALFCFISDFAFFCNIYLSIFALILLLSNDVHPNPGPSFNIKAYEDFVKLISEDHSNCTKYIHINFQSMSGKPDFFRETMTDLHDCRTVIGISETWLNATDDSNTWSFDKQHLQMYRKDRSAKNSKKKGGGVVLYVPSQFNPKHRTDFEQNSNNIDHVWVEADSPKESLYKRQLIGMFYCPDKSHHGELFDILNSALEQCSGENKEIVILGDFNINILNDSESTSIKNLLTPFDMECLNKTIPTRISTTTSTLIDHFFVCSRCEFNFHVSEFPFSDHNLICAVSKYSSVSDMPTSEQKITYRNKKLYRKDKFLE